MHDALHIARRATRLNSLALLSLMSLCACSAGRDGTRADGATPDMRAVDAKVADATVADARVMPGDAQPAHDATPYSDAGSTANGAHVTAVSVAGPVGAYTLSVTLRSPDTGCDQYANWWEVLDADGALLYRRILGHSHVDEQPFTRSGGPVDAQADQIVWVRAHLHPGGYGGAVMRGTPGGAFVVAPQPAGWPDVEAQPPQPTGCAF